MSKTVATTTAGALTSEDFSYISDEDAGAGVIGMGGDDLALPFLKVLQALSPAVTPGLSEYIEGAKAGMFMNSVNKKVFEGRTTGLIFIPCGYKRDFLEWVDRDAGGGLAAIHSSESGIMSKTKKDANGKYRMPNGNMIVETAIQYGLCLDPDTHTYFQCAIALKSFGLGVSRALNNTLMTTTIPGKMAIAPRWLYPYVITTTLVTKDKHAWSQIAFTKQDHPVSKEVYLAAKAYAEAIKAGLVDSKGHESDDIQKSSQKEDDMPF